MKWLKSFMKKWLVCKVFDVHTPANEESFYSDCIYCNKKIENIGGIWQKNKKSLDI